MPLIQYECPEGHTWDELVQERGWSQGKTMPLPRCNKCGMLGSRCWSGRYFGKISETTFMDPGDYEEAVENAKEIEREESENILSGETEILMAKKTKEFRPVLPDHLRKYSRFSH